VQGKNIVEQPPQQKTGEPTCLRAVAWGFGRRERQAGNPNL